MPCTKCNSIDIGLLEQVCMSHLNRQTCEVCILSALTLTTVLNEVVTYNYEARNEVR